MSGFNLNANANSFVPGQFKFGARPNTVSQQQPSLVPVERPEQTEAPKPAPTLSIGRPKPPPEAKLVDEERLPSGASTPTPAAASASIPPLDQSPAVPAPGPKTTSAKSEAPKPSAASGSAPKTFTTQKAKADAERIKEEAKAVADQETLKDLFGDESGEKILPAPLSNGENKTTSRISASERKRIFKQIIVKCVLQLLLIEMTNELLQNNEVYDTIPPEHLLRLMGVLDHSYQFARMFNEDKELRTALWKVGFMKHLPNLLKQETSSAETLVTVLLRMYYDPRPQHLALRPQVADKFLPLGLGVVSDFNKLRMEHNAKNIATFMPVVAKIMHGFGGLDDKAFGRYLPAIYPIAAELVARDTSSDVRKHLQAYFVRVGQHQGIMDRL